MDADALPSAIRRWIAELTGHAVGDAAFTDLPSRLRPLTRFSPAKRAKVAEQTLVEAVMESASLRANLALWCTEHRPEALEVDHDDAVIAGVARLLQGQSSAAHLVELVWRREQDGQLAGQRDAALTRVRKLSEELDAAQTKLAEAERGVDRAREERADEVRRLHKRLRDQGAKLKEATESAAQAREELREARQSAEESVRAAQAERDRYFRRAESFKEKAASASADADVAHQSAQHSRYRDEMRLRLLLDTLGEAVDGLNRELSHGTDAAGEHPRPADMVRGASTASTAGSGVADHASLDRLLCLSSAHLIVDGYNVTKTGYPELPLSEQRDRLVHQLSSLCARTSAEVTVVFDGAGVIAVPMATPKRVRVLFSDPGVTADDVIRSLVDAEPYGRPLVVATSDREVADSVRDHGAHTVASSVLVSRLRRI